MTGLFRVNRLFQAFCGASELPREPRNLAAKTAAGRPGLAPKVRSDSIEAREDTHSREKIKGLVSPILRSLWRGKSVGLAASGSLSPASHPRVGGGYLVTASRGVNRSFSRMSD